MPIAVDGYWYENNVRGRAATAEEYLAFRAQYPNADTPQWFTRGYDTVTSWEQINADRSSGILSPRMQREREATEQHRLLRTWFSQQRQRQQGNQSERGQVGGGGGGSGAVTPRSAPGGILGGSTLLGG
jgi:hypothetical protein